MEQQQGSGTFRLILVLTGLWLAVEAIGNVLGIVRRVGTLIVLVLALFVGWRVLRAGKS